MPIKGTIKSEAAPSKVTGTTHTEGAKNYLQHPLAQQPGSFSIHVDVIGIPKLPTSVSWRSGNELLAIGKGDNTCSILCELCQSSAQLHACGTVG